MIAPHNTTSTPTMTHREGMSSGAPVEFGEHRVETHARETDLSVVYTIDPAVVDEDMMAHTQLGDRNLLIYVGMTGDVLEVDPATLYLSPASNCSMVFM